MTNRIYISIAILWLTITALFMLCVAILGNIDKKVLFTWDADNQIIKARMYEEKGNFERAAGEYGRFLPIDKTNFEVVAGRAYALLLSGETDEALEQAVAAQDLVDDSNELRAKLLLARCLLESGEVEEAGTLYNEVLKSAPDSGEAHYGMARVAEARHEYTQMIEHLRLCAQLGDAKSWHAYSQERAHKRRQIENLNAQLAGTDDASLIYRILGLRHKELGEWDRAVDMFEKAAAGRPSLTDVVFWIAVDRYVASNVEEARELCRRVLEYDPNFEAARDLLNRLQ